MYYDVEYNSETKPIGIPDAVYKSYRTTIVSLKQAFRRCHSKVTLFERNAFADNILIGVCLGLVRDNRTI